MTATKTQEVALQQLCRTVIEQKLGNLSGLPQGLADCVFRVYREFKIGYLNMLRQQENRPAKWIPETVWIDSDLTDQMRHFFSDYQHVTRNFYIVNHKMEQLLAINRDDHSQLYHHMVTDILERFARRANPEDQDGKNE